MAPPASPVPQTVLLDVMGITEQCAEKHTAMATACTSIGREVEFWLKEVTVGDRIILLQLHTSNLETPNPYGGRAIRYFPEVVCSHDGIVLLRLTSPHKNFPTEYFVYGHHHHDDDDQQGRPWVIRLPMMKHGIYSRNSVGMLRAAAGDHYVVANLRLQVHPRTWQMQAFMDRYWSRSRDKKWSQHLVTLRFAEEEDEEFLLREWQTDLVLPFGDGDSLMWVDLLQGILLCHNLLDDDSSCTELKYVRLPHNMPPARPAEGDDQRGRPEQFRSIGCTADGEIIKLVNIHRRNHYSVEAGIWTLHLQSCRRSWRKEAAGSLSPSLWSSCSTLQATSSSGSLPPLFPALSMDGDILYLTVAGEEKAHLLQIDTKTWALKDSSSYPRTFSHRNPPYPTELYKYLHSQGRIPNRFQQWTPRQLRRPCWPQQSCCNCCCNACGRARQKHCSSGRRGSAAKIWRVNSFPSTGSSTNYSRSPNTSPCQSDLSRHITNRLFRASAI